MRASLFRPLPDAVVDMGPALGGFSAIVLRNKPERGVMKADHCFAAFLDQAVLHV